MKRKETDFQRSIDVASELWPETLPRRGANQYLWACILLAFHVPEMVKEQGVWIFKLLLTIELSDYYDNALLTGEID